MPSMIYAAPTDGEI